MCLQISLSQPFLYAAVNSCIKIFLNSFLVLHNNAFLTHNSFVYLILGPLLSFKIKLISSCQSFFNDEEYAPRYFFSNSLLVLHFFAASIHLSLFQNNVLPPIPPVFATFNIFQHLQLLCYLVQV